MKLNKKERKIKYEKLTNQIMQGYYYIFKRKPIINSPSVSKGMVKKYIFSAPRLDDFIFHPHRHIKKYW